jgi:hypothetical protein
MEALCLLFLNRRRACNTSALAPPNAKVVASATAASRTRHGARVEKIGWRSGGARIVDVLR